jgi:hypothetical protein
VLDAAGEGVQDGLSDAKLLTLEKEAIDEITVVALRHVNRLPSRSEWRPRLIRLAALRSGLRPRDDQAPPDEAGAEPASTSLPSAAARRG